MSEVTDLGTVDVKKVTADIIATIDREREREIINRRFGLNDRRETLEQIGELLGITRERVRQLEKAIISRLKAQAEDNLPHMRDVEKVLVANLHDMGRVARISDLAAKVTPESENGRAESRVAWLCLLSPKITVLEENDNFFYGAGIAEFYDEAAIKDKVSKLVAIVTEHAEPLTVNELFDKSDLDHPDHVQALASLSKQLANLNGKWGLNKWPTVNPKNIRDKIYVILQEGGKPMHFGAIADSIKNSTFKRKNVTTQAIHNELIKDDRFVLIGRGIYALKEWGYKRGTVADMIADVLKKENGPLHRDEIVKRVLKLRQVKETTILLNLQGKPQFKRVAKATYALEEA